MGYISTSSAEQASHAAAIKVKCGTRNHRLACGNMPNSISCQSDTRSSETLEDFSQPRNLSLLSVNLFQPDSLCSSGTWQKSCRDGRNLKSYRIFSVLINLINCTLNRSQINFNCECLASGWCVCMGKLGVLLRFNDGIGWWMLLYNLNNPQYCFQMF